MSTVEIIQGCFRGMFSVNRGALKILEEVISNSEYYGVKVEKVENGGVIVDAGVKARGGYEVGLKITEICMGGLGRACLTVQQYGDHVLPATAVYTDEPCIATLGSQFAGWRIKVGDFFALGSGPARAISQEPKELYRKIQYKDESDVAVIVFETDKYPSAEVFRYIAEKCHVEPSKVYSVITPTSSIAGCTQISGRIVETGIHKLTELGFDPKKIVYGAGVAPIAPIHPKFARAMGRTNDVIIASGQVFLTVDYDGTDLEDYVKKAPSSTSKIYGKPFFEIFKEAGYDFYKIDPAIFSPAHLTVSNVKDGKVYTAGKIDAELLKKSLEA